MAEDEERASFLLIPLPVVDGRLAQGPAAVTLWIRHLRWARKGGFEHSGTFGPTSPTNCSIAAELVSI